jgi:hypothetical protein
MMLTGLEERLKECRKAIQDHVNKCVLTVDCDDFPLHTWDQATIDSFYRYCFERQVLPEFNSSNEKFKLSGPKEQVNATQMEFYRVKGIKAEEARIASYARIAVWMFETSNETYEKYSLKLNALIETAFTNNNTSVRIYK